MFVVILHISVCANQVHQINNLIIINHLANMLMHYIHIFWNWIKYMNSYICLDVVKPNKCFFANIHTCRWDVLVYIY